MLKLLLFASFEAKGKQSWINWSNEWVFVYLCQFYQEGKAHLVEFLRFSSTFNFFTMAIGETLAL